MSFGTPRYPGPNKVIQTPYQNQDPHDPCNIPLPTSERLWMFGYTGSSAIPPSTTNTYYRREREGWIVTGESFPQPNFYPQQTAQYQQVAPHPSQPPGQQVIQNTPHGQHQPTGQVAQYVQQSTPSNLPYLVSWNPTPQTTPNYLSRSYPLPEGVYDVAMDRVLTAIRITLQAFCNQAQDLLNRLGFTTTVPDSEGLARKLLYVNDLAERGKLTQPAALIFQNDQEIQLNLRRLVDEIHITDSPRHFSDPGDPRFSVHLTRRSSITPIVATQGSTSTSSQTTPLLPTPSQLLQSTPSQPHDTQHRLERKSASANLRMLSGRVATPGGRDAYKPRVSNSEEFRESIRTWGQAVPLEGIPEQAEPSTESSHSHTLSYIDEVPEELPPKGTPRDET
ncbi:hypothetical protein DXG01_014821 [Tephrocybe rancida]|nr:hypothetical protein DXG01_014821 [Tephrocybe rancida]